MFLLNIVDNTLKKIKSHLANCITVCNMGVGGASIMASLNGAYSYSALFIFIAALLDRYDGKVARKYNQESELGKQLDSMSDIISFGVAPAILLYEAILHQFGVIGMIITVFYICCGALRLARFNISETPGYFIGLPITVAGTILTVLYLLYFFFPSFNNMLLMVILPMLSILMIGSFKLKKV